MQAKKPDTSRLVKKTNCNNKISEMKNKILNIAI